jgi:hypothetical protein
MYFFTKVYLIVLSLTAIIALLKIKNCRLDYMRFLIITILITLGVELTGRLIASHHKKNFLLFTVFIPILYFLLSSVYYSFFFQQLRLRKAIRWSQLLFPFFCLWNAVYGEGLTKFNSYSILLMSLLLLTWVFIYFNLKFKDPDKFKLTHEPMFWVSSGLLIFYGTTAFAMGAYNYFLDVDIKIAALLLNIIQILNIPMNIFFILALLCLPYRQAS